MNIEELAGFSFSWLKNMGLSTEHSETLGAVINLFVLLLVTYLIGRLLVRIATRIAFRLTSYTKAEWDDILLSRKVVGKLLSISTPFLFYICIPLAFDSANENLRNGFRLFVTNCCAVVIVIMIARFISALLAAIEEIFSQKEIYQTHPIKGMVQIIQIFVYIIAFIIAISIIIDKSPIALLTGLGAATAVILLIFQDTILGFVSGFQLSANKMVRVGDWITMSKYGVDGTIMEISLNTVKIRNFDNTIITLPPTALVKDSFQNWRGMSESGGRRVKRSVSIDTNSVKFCTTEMLERFKKVQLLTDYVDQKEKEVHTHNQQHQVDENILVNGRHQTNIGVLRAYLTLYLTNHPQVNHSMTCMVRHLAPTEEGIPIELYFFTTTTDWVLYESIMADVFDHVLAIIPFFELRVFQLPSGDDLRKTLSAKGGGS